MTPVLAAHLVAQFGSTAIGFYLALLSLVGLVCIALTRDTSTDPLSPGIAERREVAVPG